MLYAMVNLHAIVMVYDHPTIMNAIPNIMGIYCTYPCKWIIIFVS